MNFALNVPINSTSFGNASVAILREAYKDGISPSVFPIGGNVDLSAQNNDNDFNLWLQSCINKAMKHHKRDIPVFKLWHINSSFEAVSRKQGLYFFHETDSPTDEELNIVDNQDISFVSSRYTKEVFENGGANPSKIKYAPLGFDSFNFKKTAKEYLGKDVTVFTIAGKMEARKKSLRVISLWAKRFGNDKRYRLDCLIFNPFMDPNQQNAAIAQALENKQYWNIQFFPFLRTNAEVNDFVNHSQIDLTGLSGLEGFNFPLFNALCLGKWGVALNAHAHRDYCTAENSILVEPTSMVKAEDGMFFIPGQRFNQGNFFDCSDEAIIDGMERALTKAHTPNPEGEKLKEVFNYQKTYKAIKEGMETLQCIK